MNWLGKKLKSKGFVIFATLIAIFISYSETGQNFVNYIEVSLNLNDIEIDENEYQLRIHVLDVGCSDCMIIETNDSCYIIDGGTPEYEDYIYSYVLELGIEKIDAVFITHPDYDHYSGFTKLFENIEISTIYTTSVDSDSTSYISLMEVVEEQNINCSIATKGDIFVSGDLTLEVISPEFDYNSDNNMSLVIMLEYNDFSVLLTGDAEEEAFADIINSENIDCDILKVSHHGSSNGTSDELLEAVTADFAFISTSPEKYGFPTQDVIDLLNEYSVEYFRTDLEGTIVFYTDGIGNLIILTKENVYERTYN